MTRRDGDGGADNLVVAIDGGKPAGTAALSVSVFRRARTRWAVATGVVATIVLNAVELGRGGIDAERWGMLADISEVIVALLAAVVLFERSQLTVRSPRPTDDVASTARFDARMSGAHLDDVADSDALDRRAGWLWLAAGAVAWALGQVVWIIVEFAYGTDPTVSIATIGFVAWALFTARGLVGIAGLTRAWSTVRPMVGEAAVLSLVIGFLVWELALAPDITNESNLTILLLALVPIMTSFVIAVALLLSIHDRSAVIATIALAGTMLVIADAFLTVHFADGANLYSSAHALYLVTFALVGTAALLPHRAEPLSTRSSLARLVLVYVPLIAAVWVAVWRFVIDHRDATIVSVLIGLLIGVVLLFAQIARWKESEEMAAELDANVTRLHSTQSDLRDLLDDLPEAVLVVSSDGVISDVNAHTMALTGRSHADLIGQLFLGLVGPENRRMLYRSWRQLLKHDRMISPVFALRHVDGREVMVEADVRNPVAHVDRVVVTLRDITNRLNEAAELELAQNRFGLAFRSAPTGMAMASADDFSLIDVNDALAQMLGYAREQLIGRRLHELTHIDDRGSFDPRGIATVAASVLEHRYIRHDGQIVWANTSVGKMADRGGHELVIVHIQDVTESRRTAARLQWAASHDELTGLPNRTHFLDQLRRRLEGFEPGSIAVLFIDLDNFKVINDSLGHAVGDELLRGMSERLRSVVGDRDLLGRFGGDEFIVMLDGLHMNMTPADIAERLRSEIALPLQVDDSELYVTGSIGIAYADRIGVTADELLRDADAAMYRAKTRGRDCVEAFSPGAHETSVLALRTASELRHGLERGEIVPYYQPIVDLVSGHLTGFEVLARWRHPDRGLLGPDQFLPMAEETGLIAELGASILRSSLAQLGHWQANIEALANVSISVNVSVRQLVDARFHAVVADALAETGVLADSLWLEITESALMSDVKAATVALRNLRNLGLHLSVDDFGTGYSSLTYLKRFPVEAIKVDRTFVKGLGIDVEDTTIVEAVVNLGRSLGLMVVAEGVETPLQLSRLREMGCNRAQGYLFGRPRPAALIEAERAGTSAS